MSLTTTDLYEIRSIIEEVVEDTFETKGRVMLREEIAEAIKPLEGQVEALSNDIKELYAMV